MAVEYFEAVAGITSGLDYHTKGVVFRGGPDIIEHYAETQGKDETGRVLYKKVTKKEYQQYLKDSGVEVLAEVSSTVGHVDGKHVTPDEQEKARKEAEASKTPEEKAKDEADAKLIAAFAEVNKAEIEAAEVEAEGSDAEDDKANEE